MREASTADADGKPSWRAGALSDVGGPLHPNWIPGGLAEEVAALAVLSCVISLGSCYCSLLNNLCSLFAGAYRCNTSDVPSCSGMSTLLRTVYPVCLQYLTTPWMLLQLCGEQMCVGLPKQLRGVRANPRAQGAGGESSSYTT